MDFKNRFSHNTPAFTLSGTHCFARVVDVHDGDTLKVIMPVFGDHYYKFNVRLFGVDACELRSKCEANRVLAMEARSRLTELITGNPDTSDFDAEPYVVYLRCANFDKYGRLLANVFSDTTCDTSFSDILINEGLVYSYGGKTKKTEAQQLAVLRKDV